ncbi:TSCPD domain-containing protein [Clostridia bacterium]|nr:TSCPD domain-containing protein [Clostridia bacterium]
MEYKMKNTCAKSVSFDLNDGKVTNVSFASGCPGNLKGIAALAEGMDAADLIARLSGVRCGDKDTSCPDQFAKALLASI